VTVGPGSYDVYFDLYGGNPVTTVKGHVYVLGEAALGNFTASPASQTVSTGGAATVTLTSTGLTPGLRYLGTLTFGDGSTVLSTSYVTITS
jgi:hypothetical protein